MGISRKWLELQLAGGIRRRRCDCHFEHHRQKQQPKVIAELTNFKAFPIVVNALFCIGKLNLYFLYVLKNNFVQKEGNMNILVIGNGFDLAHGLPTKYTDFLDFIKEFQDFQPFQIPKDFQSRIQLLCSPRKKAYPNYFYNLLNKNSTLYSELITLTTDNSWLRYFIEIYNSKGNGWIDFESEISKKLFSIYLKVNE